MSSLKALTSETFKAENIVIEDRISKPSSDGKYKSVSSKVRYNYPGIPKPYSIKLKTPKLLVTFAKVYDQSNKTLSLSTSLGSAEYRAKDHKLTELYNCLLSIDEYTRGELKTRCQGLLDKEKISDEGLDDIYTPLVRPFKDKETGKIIADRGSFSLKAYFNKDTGVLDVDLFDENRVPIRQSLVDGDIMLTMYHTRQDYKDKTNGTSTELISLLGKGCRIRAVLNCYKMQYTKGASLPMNITALRIYPSRRTTSDPFADDSDAEGPMESTGAGVGTPAAESEIDPALLDDDGTSNPDSTHTNDDPLEN